MENLLKFFDELSLEEHLYWRVRCDRPPDPPVGYNQQSGLLGEKSLSSSTSFLEIRWQRGKKPFSWSFRTSPQGEWQASSTTLLESRLPTLGVSLDSLRDELVHQIRNQLVHAQMVLEAGDKLLSEQARGQVPFTKTSVLEADLVASAAADSREPRNSRSTLAQGGGKGSQKLSLVFSRNQLGTNRSM